MATGKASRRKGEPAERKTVGRKRLGQPAKIRNTDPGLFGQNLEELIRLSGLTIQEFSGRIDTSVDVVYRYINGTRTPPFKHWRKIAAALGKKSVNDLLPPLPIS